MTGRDHVINSRQSTCRISLGYPGIYVKYKARNCKERFESPSSITGQVGNKQLLRMVFWCVFLDRTTVIALTQTLEGFVILKKNPDYEAWTQVSGPWKETVDCIMSHVYSEPAK